MEFDDFLILPFLKRLLKFNFSPVFFFFFSLFFLFFSFFLGVGQGSAGPPLGAGPGARAPCAPWLNRYSSQRLALASQRLAQVSQRPAQAFQRLIPLRGQI